MDDLPAHLLPLQFDHEAAFEADRAIDALIRSLDLAARVRQRLAGDILCRSGGPFAVHLARQVEGASTETAWVIAGLRSLQAQVSDARDEALAEDLRRQVGEIEWQEQQAVSRGIERLASGAMTKIGSSVASAGVSVTLPE